MTAKPMHARIVGTGLIGTSIGLRLRDQGAQVALSDPSPTAQALARDLGAGSLEQVGEPDVVVVAAPPDVAASVVLAELDRWPTAVVTDVASIKAAVQRDVLATATAAQAARYVGSHPMAGRERSGAVAARADLFLGCTWVVCPSARSGEDATQTVRQLALLCGGAVVTMPADAHDTAVAVVSHVPQLASSLVAARLREVDDDAVRLAGQGVRDVTRIAASDPMLWTQILAGNAAAVAPVLHRLREDLQEVAEAITRLDGHTGDDAADGARAVIAQTIEHGRAGHARIPGKHGSAPTEYATLLVVVPDEPGQLGRLFADMGAAGINLEDLRLEHGVGAAFGVAEVSVLPGVVERLRTVLSTKGWSVHE